LVSAKDKVTRCVYCGRTMWSCRRLHVQPRRYITDTSLSTWNLKYW